MAGYSRRDVDRMAVLHDLWRSEAGYQDNKMKVQTNNKCTYVHIMHILVSSLSYCAMYVAGELLFRMLSSYF